MTTKMAPARSAFGPLLKGSRLSVAVPQASAADTLLTYAMEADPSPARVGTKTTLTLDVSNSTRGEIACTKIVVTFKVGENGKDLTADADGISTTKPDGWDVKQSKGTFTLTPTGDAGKIEGQGLAFTFANVRVNDETGTTAVTITETAALASQPATSRSTTISLSKWPQRFSLSALRVVSPPELVVNEGGTATLTWKATGDDGKATYTMRYEPGDEAATVKDTVGSSGPYTSAALTRSSGVVFTLTAELRVDGQDEPLVAQRQAAVAVTSMFIKQFLVEPTKVGVNGLVRIRWNVPNADRCVLNDGVVLPASGTRFVALAASRDITLYAYDAAGNELQDQRYVTVDPAIVPTEAGYVITGDNGRNGQVGNSCMQQDRFCKPTEGEPGGKGGDVTLQVTVPALDPTDPPRRVIPIVVAGGTGGKGGDGGAVWGIVDAIGGRNGGGGGKGGNAVLDLALDASLPQRAQYIVRVAGGAGGQGGDGGGPRSRSGSAGAAGSASMTISQKG